MNGKRRVKTPCARGMEGDGKAKRLRIGAALIFAK